MFQYLRRRQKFFCAILSFVLILNIMSTVPVLALSTGPQQVEYSSYESGASSDMVNVMTGDFNYSMPLLDVPGPEGPFSIPLFYHAGIMLEQDASWCGLGWNLNVGSITREVVGYNDDAYDNSQFVNVNDPGGRGWIKNYGFYRRTWDSQRGYGGAVTLLNIVGAEWNNSSGLQTGTLIGLNFNKGGINGNWVKNVFNVANVAMTIASYGSSSGAQVGAEAPLKSVVIDAAADAITSAAQLAQGYLSYGTFASRYHNINQVTDTKFGKTEYRYWLDDTRTERAFGSLYLGSTSHTTLSPTLNPPDYNDAGGTDYPRLVKFPQSITVSKGFIRDSNGNLVTSDMYVNVLPDENYSSVTRPNNISYDLYNVMSDGIEGGIAPYRLEVGSLAQPKRFSYLNTAFNLIPFIEENNTDNKVQFYYPGQAANRYTYHDDTNFGVDYSTYDANGKKYLLYTVTNDKLLGGSRTDVDATRINGKKVVSGKNIEWYSNDEILTGAARLKGFIDAPNDRPDWVRKGIGGYSITREDGRTYHYAIPVYKTQEVDLVAVEGQEEQKYSRAGNFNPVAISWLLTAITGADYVDRGQIGLLDDEDWGYWVKFNYGLTSQNYAYRFPYIGYFDEGESVRYSQGVRQQYYLNSIETRSHAALFIKGVRTDGLSSYLKRNDITFGHDTESGLTTPTPPLFLDEVVLLSKDDFSALKNLGFNEEVNASLGFAGLSSDNGNLGSVYDIADIQGNHRDFINAKASRRIKFVYETDESHKLCKKSLNSFANIGNPPAVDASDIYAGKQGKLTLKRLQYFGRNSIKVFPDYKFEYGFNPDYNKDFWDGWGYYNPNSTSSLTSHKASKEDQNGSAWSLSKIVFPMGGSLSVSYERDSYSSVSGERVVGTSSPTVQTGSFTFTDVNSLPSQVVTPLASELKVGELVKATGLMTYSYNGLTYSRSYDNLYTVKAITGNQVNLGTNFSGIDYSSIPSGVTITIVSNNGIMYRYDKKGGDIRVSNLSFVDEFGDTRKIQYSYLNDDGTSSGVVAKEPEFIKGSDNPNNFGLDNVYDYPSTPVLYSKVTVSSGYNKLTNEFSGKQVYEFETPDKTLVTQVSTSLFDNIVPDYHYITSNGLRSETVYLKQYLHKSEIRNSRVGKLRSVRIYDKNNSLIETTLLGYTERMPQDQGIYTSGSILSEITSSGEFLDYHVQKLIKTTKVYYPYQLNKITKIKDNIQQTKDIIAWDFYTGAPLITETTSQSGAKIREETNPAYSTQYSLSGNVVRPYSSMGLKGFDSSNKNMVSQSGSGYKYLLNANGQPLGVIEAHARKWKNDWNNYRVYNSSSDSYADAAEGPSIWRMYSNYTWLGDFSRYNADGYRAFVENDRFDFNPASPNGGWKQVSIQDRYDHFSMPLTTSMISGTESGKISSSLKIGYDNKLKIADATNASYNEFAFSGAEDLQSNGFFGGEVKKGSGVVVNSAVHTGTNAISLTTGYSFVYNTSGLEPGKKYKSSVWTTSLNGRLYYKVNDGSEQLSQTPVATKKIGNWYLLEINIPVQTSSFSLEVGVKSAGGTVLFDDFRFQPIESSMICYVYNPATFELDYFLDNNNLFTHYEFNDAGDLQKVYQESFTYGVRLIDETRSDYRRFHVDQ